MQGGAISYAQDATDLVNNATAEFHLTNTDPKAQAIITYHSVAGQVSLSFHDTNAFVS